MPVTSYLVSSLHVFTPKHKVDTLCAAISRFVKHCNTVNLHIHIKLLNIVNSVVTLNSYSFNFFIIRYFIQVIR